MHICLINLQSLIKKYYVRLKGSERLSKKFMINGSGL